MKFDESWEKKPKKGFELIYRYYDSDNYSYIGHTKRSLCARAGGKSAANYLKSESKFKRAILDFGFSSFEYEILDEVPAEEVEKKVIDYMRMYNSIECGYNSDNKYKETYIQDKPYVINLKDFSVEQIDNLFHNIMVYMNPYNKVNIADIDAAFKKYESSWGSVTYNYYSSEEFYSVVTHPITLLLNYIDMIVAKKYNSIEEINDDMICEEILGGDLLTGGDYRKISVIVLDGGTVSFDI